MGNWRDGVGNGQRAEWDAVDWFVGNTSDIEPEMTTLLQWRWWFCRPRNCADYVGVVEMQQRLRLLPPPAHPNREALVADAGADLPLRCGED